MQLTLPIIKKKKKTFQSIHFPPLPDLFKMDFGIDSAGGFRLNPKT